MSVFAVMLVKDEADVICQNVRHLIAEGVDHIVVADNGSIDGTTEHLRDFERHGFVTYTWDPDPAYRQADKTQRLVGMAGQMGARWVVPVDADEFWYSPHGRLGDVLRSSRHHVLWAEGMYHVPHVDDDAAEPDPVRRMRHRRAGRDCPQSKVCFRYAPTARMFPGNHGVTHPGERNARQGMVAFREFQYRSFEHFVRKVRNGKAAYDAAPDLSRELGIHWRRLGAMSDDELGTEWDAYLATPTVLDPAPIRTTEHSQGSTAW